MPPPRGEWARMRLIAASPWVGVEKAEWPGRGRHHRWCTKLAEFDRTAHNRRIARLGGLAFSASHDGHAATERARVTFLRGFELQVRERFPDLGEEEVARRAEALRRLHYAQLAYRSALMRAKGRSGDRQ